MPASGAAAALSPLGLSNVRVTDGLWAERRRVNREVTIPHGLRMLQAAGNLSNFERAAGVRSDRYVAGLDDVGIALPFLDSDVYKWLEAVAWSLATEQDSELEREARELMVLIERAQRPDGYLNTFFQVARPGREFTDLEWGHELYTLGHLIQAAVAWRRAIGDETLLRIARRAVARVALELGPGRRPLVDGHPEIEMALVELYRLTSEASFLELAKLLINRRGRGLLGAGRFGPRYWQDHQPVLEALVPAGHAVRQVYLDCGAVDVAVETGDAELLAAVIRRWEAMTASRTYLTGGLGSRHRDEAFGDPYELPPDLAYSETCAAIGSVMLAWRLLLATGEARFADLIERTSLNAVLAGLSEDGRAFFYSNPLQRRSGGLLIQDGPASSLRAPWFACACCPPNLMRFLGTLPDMVATTDGAGVQIHQYTTSSIRAQLGVGIVGLRVTTAYPDPGEVSIEIETAPSSSWVLSLRVPEWSPQATVDTPSGRHEVTPGSVRLEGPWRAGDRITLHLDMSARLTWPDSRIDATRGCAAIERGPLVYAIEEADLPSGVTPESVRLVSNVASAGVTAETSGSCGVEWPGFVASTSERQMAWPYGSWPIGTAPTMRSSGIRAIPYFRWGNRQPGGMRVWVPVMSAEEGQLAERLGATGGPGPLPAGSHSI